MTHVRETSDGWVVVDGAKSVRFDDASSALSAALPSIRAGRTKAPLFHDRTSKRPNGEWRWFDAASEEAEPLRGSRHDAVTIEELVESLNATEIARPIDGGPASSEHGTEIIGSDTIANGWAHWAVLVERADGTKHAATFAEVHPAIAPFTDDGRLAFLSIATRGKSLTDDAAIRGASWSSASFTNKPGNRGLMSLAAMRTEEAAAEVVAHRTHRLDVYASRTETSMSTENTQTAPATPPVEAKRAEMDPKLAEAVMKAMEGGATMEQILAALEGLKPAPEAEPVMESEPATRSEIEKAVLSRIAKLEADHERTALRSHVEHEFAKAKAAPSDLDSLVTDLLAVPASSPVRAKLLALSIRSAVGAPPIARPLPAAGSVDVTSEAATPSDVTDGEIDAELVAVRAEFPKDPKHHQWARARKRALAKKNGR